MGSAPRVLGFFAWLVLGGLGLGGCRFSPPSADDYVPGSTTEGSDTSLGEVSTSPSGEAVCGDGIVEGDEQCDDAGESAACNDDCTSVVCGDGSVNIAAGEQCDGAELAGETCASQGFSGGELACSDACSYDVAACSGVSGVPVLMLGFSQVKRFDFSWREVAGADYYQLEQSLAPGEPFVQLGGDIGGVSISHEQPLHFAWEASYRLRACSDAGCSDSAVVDVTGALAEAVGYLKASNTGTSDYLGHSVALSADGNTLAIGADGEGSSATGIDGNQADNTASSSGAVYVFVRDGAGAWSQQAYVKASNPGASDDFGWSVALSSDGSTLAVGALFEDGGATGIGGNEADGSASASGAVYVFVRDGSGAWSQEAYVKASNTGASDYFGYSVALSGDGDTLAVGAPYEDSNATGIGGDQADDSSANSGAIYVFVRDEREVWSQQAYVKASNTGANDELGNGVALSEDGNTLAVGALLEGSSATGVGGDQADDSAPDSGAVFVFVRDEREVWSQQAYVKASNTGAGDYFGYSLALDSAGSTLAVGARYEDSDATGVDGDQANAAAASSGAVYVFVRDERGAWSQQAYVKASNTGASDSFGNGVALSADGNTLAVGAYQEDSNAKGIGGNQAADAAADSGAIYVLVRDGMGTWSQQAYIKAPNTGVGDGFGDSVALSEDGTTLAVGSYGEDSNATGIGGGQTNDSATNSGAVYLY